MHPRSEEGLSCNHLVESIEQLRNQWAARTRRSQSVHQSKMLQVSDKPTNPRGRKGERVAPEVPLKCDDRETGHTGPEHRKSGFPSSKAGVKEPQPWDHEEHHGRSHDNVGLVARGVPLVQVFYGWRCGCISGFLIPKRAA